MSCEDTIRELENSPQVKNLDRIMDKYSKEIDSYKNGGDLDNDLYWDLFDHFNIYYKGNDMDAEEKTKNFMNAIKITYESLKRAGLK